MDQFFFSPVGCITGGGSRHFFSEPGAGGRGAGVLKRRGERGGGRRTETINPLRGKSTRARKLLIP